MLVLRIVASAFLALVIPIASCGADDAATQAPADIKRDYRRPPPRAIENEALV